MADGLVYVVECDWSELYNAWIVELTDGRTVLSKTELKIGTMYRD